MLTSVKESALYPIANPGSMAFFGASNTISAMGTNLLMSVLDLGFKGPIYPVHPKERQVQDLKAYPDVMDLPEVPDLAVLVLPTRIVCQTMEACGRKGIRHAIVVSGGFKEVGSPGIELEKELAEVAARYGIRFLGPNCIGVANPHHNLNTTFVPFEGRAGFVGLASQSGSFITQMFNYLARLGLGFSTAFSVGNEANIDLVDAMEYLGVCPHTKVIGLYIEGINRGRRFVETARSIVPHKPIVALYVGGSETGRRAGLSHTGAMAGPDPLYDGMFRQSGVIRAQSVTELFDFCWGLGSMPPPRGPRVVIQTQSGGPGAAAADSCGRAGLELPALSKETLDKLEPFVPHTGSVNNPVDLTFTKNLIHYYSEIPQVLIQERNADMLLIYLFMAPKVVRRALRSMGMSEEQMAETNRKLMDAQAQSISRLLETQDKPVMGYTFSNPDDPAVRSLSDRGVPVFTGPDRAARTIRAMVQYTRLRDRILSDTGQPAPSLPEVSL
jgi:acetyl-CoA synthetase (ADP-forming)